MSSAEFVISFEGEKLKNGKIDVRDLAPALLSLGHAIDAANAAINGDSQPVRVEAKAVSVGCFEVAIDVVLPFWQNVQDLLVSKDVNAAKQILEWIGILTPPAAAVGGGLFWLFRKLNGQPIKRAKHQDDGTVKITYEDGTLDQTLFVPMEVLRLYRERAVQDSLGKLLETLESDEVEAISFKEKSGGKSSSETTLTKADRKIFTAPETPPVTVMETTQEMALSIRTLAFQEGNKWRLFDGQNVITATIDDEDFVNRVDKSIERFAKGDILICKVHTTQLETRDGLRTEHRVVKMIEHRRAQTQISIPFDAPREDED